MPSETAATDDVLMCMQTKHTPDYAIAHGSVVGQCSDCNADVWVSVSGQKALQTIPGMKRKCVVCVGKDIQTKGMPDEVNLVPGAIQEVLAWMKRTGRN